MLKEILVMKRIMSICLALALVLTPTLAFANSKTYNFNGWFADESSVAAGENALASQAAAKVCPSYGSWTDSFQPFSYTHTNFVFWQDYSASNVNFSVTCTWQQVRHTFSGAWFANEGSVQDGENAIETDLWQNVCGGGNHQLTNMQFNSFTYTHTNFVFWQDYSATGISGSFTCDT
jgi:hypothetical protein